MEILVERKWKRDAYTIGNIYVNGKRFGDGKNYCNTLEDADRGLTQSMPLAEIKKHKIYGETAIPAGTYKVKFTFSPKFCNRAWAKPYGGKVPELLNVPAYAGVRIHPFNTAKECLGCIALGRNTAKGMVTNSTYWCGLLHKKIWEAETSGEDVMMTIR